MSLSYSFNRKRVVGSVLLLGGMVYLPAVCAKADPYVTPTGEQLALAQVTGSPNTDPRFLPQTAPPQSGASTVEGPTPKLPAGPKTEDHVILPNLKGLVFIDNVDKLKKGGVSGNGVTVENLPMLDDPAIHDQL